MQQNQLKTIKVHLVSPLHIKSLFRATRGDRIYSLISFNIISFSLLSTLFDEMTTNGFVVSFERKSSQTHKGLKSSLFRVYEKTFERNYKRSD